MSAIARLIDRIEDEFDSQFPAASEAEVKAFRGVFAQVFGIPAPEAYVDLLRRSNGIDVNGLVVYGTSDLNGEVFRYGLAESNQRLLQGVHVVESSLRFVGEQDDQLLAYDTADGRWKLVDRYSWEPDDDVEDVYPTFEALVVERVEEALE